MHLDPSLPILVAILGVVFTTGLLLHFFKLPQVIGYILAGIAIGPFGLRIFTDIDYISRIGSFAVFLLLFLNGIPTSSGKAVT